jgi:hypothetical protein
MVIQEIINEMEDDCKNFAELGYFGISEVEVHIKKLKELSKPEDAKVSNIYMVKAKFFAEKDCFGESYVVTSENTKKDLRLEVGTIVTLTAEKNRVSPYAHKSTKNHE